MVPRALGAPWENDYAESFQIRLRDEWLALEVFESLTAAMKLTVAWRADYNHHRPHSSLGYLTSVEFAARRAVSTPKLLSAMPQAASPFQQHGGVTQPVLS
jgi:transposase InsO family protein